jgi:catechol 2,3-dioxygenase-like lactoylglutathione lyase family enzyme
VSPRVFAITSFGLTTSNLERLGRFYEGLGFIAGQMERIPEEEIALLKLRGGGARLPIRLGELFITLDCFDERGLEYPRDATAADLCFQHFALVTADADAAWVLALKFGATAISTQGPVKLPVSAGSVTACKFRDPDGHPLEILQFPPGKGIQWQGDGLLGIDHSAISVSDLAASKRFYLALGLSVQRPTVNCGGTQQALDGLPEPLVDVVPMMPPQTTPHLELLAYRNPAGRPAETTVNDIAATRTVWASDRDALIQDPDGHLHVLKNQS